VWKAAPLPPGQSAWARWDWSVQWSAEIVDYVAGAAKSGSHILVSPDQGAKSQTVNVNPGPYGVTLSIDPTTQLPEGQWQMVNKSDQKLDLGVGMAVSFSSVQKPFVSSSTDTVAAVSPGVMSGASMLVNTHPTYYFVVSQLATDGQMFDTVVQETTPLKLAFDDTENVNANITVSGTQALDVQLTWSA